MAEPFERRATMLRRRSARRLACYLRSEALYPGEADERREDDEADRDKARDARELLVEAEARTVGRLDSAADRAAHAFLLRRLDGEQNDQRGGRGDEDAGHRVR